MGAFDGGLASPHSTLELALDLITNAHSVTVTINFSKNYPAVGYVKFNLFDIDFRNSGGSNYQDQITSITATSTT